MVIIRVLLLSLLVVCNVQASQTDLEIPLLAEQILPQNNQHIVDESVLKRIVYRNRLICLHNQIIESLHTDAFKQKFTPDTRATYLDDVRVQAVDRYRQFIGEIDDFSTRRQNQRTGEWQYNPHRSRELDKQAMSNLLWIRNSIRGDIGFCDKKIHAGCSREQVAEITSKVFPKRLNRDSVAHCLGDDDDSDTEALVG